MLPINPSVIWHKSEDVQQNPTTITATTSTTTATTDVDPNNKTTKYNPVQQGGPFLYSLFPPPPPPPQSTVPRDVNVEMQEEEEEEEEEKKAPSDSMGDLAVVNASEKMEEEEDEDEKSEEENNTTMEYQQQSVEVKSVVDMEADSVGDDDDEEMKLHIDFKDDDDDDNGGGESDTTLTETNVRSADDSVADNKSQAKEAEMMSAKNESKIGDKVDIVAVPLLDYLCAFMKCSLKELQVLFNNLEARKRMLTHLLTARLETTHLRPPERNQPVHAHDLSAQNANMAFACGGYLNITVRQYYYVKHGRRLAHPYLPCLIEFGGGTHASYFPLEVISVLVSHTAKPSHHHLQQMGCHHCCEN